MTLPEFQLTHVALVGARMDLFRELGFQDRNELVNRRIIPPPGKTPLEALSEPELRALLAAYLPVWVHNIIADPTFPGRHKLTMPLRRFEGELSDSRTDEVVATVLSAGFRNQPLDPLDLPGEMALRQRCAILMHISTWQDAFRTLEKDLIDILANNATNLSRWLKHAAEPGADIIDE